MAYRRSASRTRKSNTRVRARAGSGVRRRASTRRKSTGRSVRGGTQTVRIVLEQPAPNMVHRPIDLASSMAAQGPVMANGKAKF